MSDFHARKPKKEGKICEKMSESLVCWADDYLLKKVTFNQLYLKEHLMSVALGTPSINLLLYKENAVA